MNGKVLVRGSRLAWTLSACLVLAMLVALVASGVEPGVATRISLVVGLEAWAGAVVWVALRRGPSAAYLEVLGIGLAIGTIFSGFSAVLLAPTPLGRVSWLLLPILALGIVLIRQARSYPSIHLEVPGLSAWAAIALGSIVGLRFLDFNWARYPLTWTGRWTGYHTDMVFFEALGRSFGSYGPWNNALMAGTEFKYHWLAPAWGASIDSMVGATSFTSLTRALPIVALVGLICLSVALTQVLSASRWAPSLAVLLIASGGYIGAYFGGIMNFDSPPQLLGAAWFLALFAAWLLYVKGVTSHWSLCVLGILAGGAALGKASNAAVYLAGVVLVAGVGLARREPWRRRATLAAAVSAVTVALLALMFLLGTAGAGGLKIFTLSSRASTLQGLDPFPGSVGVILGTAALALAVVPRWLGLAPLIATRELRWLPETVFGLAAATTGLAAAVLLSGGIDELWFALSASSILSVISAVGVAKGLDVATSGVSRIGRLLTGGAVVLAALIVIGLVWAAWIVQGAGGQGMKALALPGAWVLALLLAWIVSVFVPASGSRWARLGAIFVAILVLASALARVPAVAPIPVAGSGVSPADANAQEPPLGWTQAEREAAMWLAREAPPDAVVATNLTNSMMVPALTGLQMHVAGAYLLPFYARKDDLAQVSRRIEQSVDFINGPSRATADALVAAGVDYVWVSPYVTETRDWEPFGRVVFADPEVILVELDQQLAR